MRSDAYRLAEMESFVQVVDSKGFSAAARILGLTPSAVSRSIIRLETRLGCQLLARTTRGIQLTLEGQSFYERCVAILEDIASAERNVAKASIPQGRVKVNSNVPFGTRYLLPLVPAFLEQHPKIQLDITLTDRLVDLVEERTDVAIRTGQLTASSLRARKLGESALVVVAAPDYLTKHGRPKHPHELRQHNCLSFNLSRQSEAWPFLVDGAREEIAPRGNALVSDGDSMRQLVLAGLGIARLARFQVAQDIEDGRLVPLLEAHSAGERQPIQALFVGPGQLVSPRVRVMLDFLAEHIRVT